MKKRFFSVLLSLVLMLSLVPAFSLTAYADDTLTFTHTGGYELELTAINQTTPPAPVNGDKLSFREKTYTCSNGTFWQDGGYDDIGTQNDDAYTLSRTWNENQTFAAGNTVYFKYVLSGGGNVISSNDIAVKIKGETPSQTDTLTFTHTGGYELEVTQINTTTPPAPVDGDILTFNGSDFTYSNGSFKNGSYEIEEQANGEYKLDRTWNANQEFTAGKTVYFKYKLSEVGGSGVYSTGNIAVKIKDGTSSQTNTLVFTHEGGYELTLAEVGTTPPAPTSEDYCTYNGTAYYWNQTYGAFMNGNNYIISTDYENCYREWVENPTMFTEGGTYHFKYKFTDYDDSNPIYSENVEVKIKDGTPTASLTYEPKTKTRTMSRTTASGTNNATLTSNYVEVGDKVTLTKGGSSTVYILDANNNWCSSNSDLDEDVGYNKYGLEWVQGETFAGEKAYYHFWATVNGTKVVSAEKVTVTLTGNSTPATKTITAIVFTPVGVYEVKKNNVSTPPLPVNGDKITVTYSDGSSEDFTYNTDGQFADFYSTAGTMLSQITTDDWECQWSDGATFNVGDEPTFYYKLGNLKSGATGKAKIVDTSTTPAVKTVTAIAFWHNGEYKVTVKDDPDGQAFTPPNPPEPVVGDKITVTYSDNSTEDFKYDSNSLWTSTTTTYDLEGLGTLSRSWNSGQTFKQGITCYFTYSLNDGSNTVTTQDIPVKFVANYTPSPSSDPSASVTTKDESIVYDAQPHTANIKVTKPTEYTIKYRTNTTDPYSEEEPTFTDVGSYTVYYEVTAKGYSTTRGSAKLTINQAANELDVVMKDWAVDEKSSDPKVKVLKFGEEKDVVFTYRLEKDKDGNVIDGGEWTKDKPTEPGTYMVRGYISGTLNYKEEEDVAEFRVLTVVQDVIEKISTGTDEEKTTAYDRYTGLSKGEQRQVEDAVGADALETARKLAEAQAANEKLVADAKAAVKALADAKEPTEALVKAAEDALAKINTDELKEMYGADLEKDIKAVETARGTVDKKAVEAAKAAVDKATKSGATEAEVKAAEDTLAALTPNQQKLYDSTYGTGALEKAKTSVSEARKTVDADKKAATDAANAALKAAEAYASDANVAKAITALNEALKAGDVAAIKNATTALNNAVKAAQGSTAKKTAKVKIKTKSKKLKASTLKKKAVTFKLKYSKTKGSGKVTFKKLKGTSKKISVSKAGKVKVKKGTKKGTYKLKVQVNVAANKTYKAAKAKKTIKVVVK